MANDNYSDTPQKFESDYFEFLGIILQNGVPHANIKKTNGKILPMRARSLETRIKALEAEGIVPNISSYALQEIVIYKDALKERDKPKNFADTIFALECTFANLHRIYIETR